MSKFFINVAFPSITAKGHIYNKFDMEISEEMYNKKDTLGVPIIYNYLYKYTKELSKDKIIITMSPDPAIVASTIAGSAEKYMNITPLNNCDVGKYADAVKYSSSLKIIYITPTSHLSNDCKTITVENLSNAVIANLTDNSTTFTKHNLALTHNQFILIGINDKLISDIDVDILNKTDITYFTMKQLRTKGINNIISYINNIINDDPVHIVFDMSVLSHDVCPCVTRFLKETDQEYINTAIQNGFNIRELEELLVKLPKKIVGLDIIGFDLRGDTLDKSYRIACEIARMPLKHILNITEKKINIFNEHSKFVIWRPLDQENKLDIGWYILRGTSLDMRESIIKQLIDEDNDDHIITLEIDNEDILISSTTMFEQQEKSYYATSSLFDCTLFPEEKIDMVFELLNSVDNKII